MSSPPDLSPGRSRVPLFPLPNVVLFPGAILPLHIFEPRYLRMTADVLDTDGRIAMALLRPGWEKDYYTRPAIEPIVCIGKIVAHERMQDGKYNFLLQGQQRASVAAESSSAGPTPYRIADLIPMEETKTLEIDLANERQRLIQLLDGGSLSSAGISRQFLRLLSGPVLTAEIADLIAFNYLQDAELKQSLLSDGDIPRRVARVVKALDGMRTSLPMDRNQDSSLN